MNQILLGSDSFIQQLQENLAKAITKSDTLSPDGIQKRLEELQQELITKANNRQSYDAIADEIFRLRDQKEKAENNLRSQKEVVERIKTLQEFIKRQPSNLTEFDESLVHMLIERITVFP